MVNALSFIGFQSLSSTEGRKPNFTPDPRLEKLGVKILFIPTQKNVKGAALYHDMLERGHVIHEAYDWNAFPENAPVISFCNEDFLAALPEIRQRMRRTVFVNCMTWLFGKEKEAMSRGLYQNENVRLPQ